MADPGLKGYFEDDEWLDPPSERPRDPVRAFPDWVQRLVDGAVMEYRSQPAPHIAVSKVLVEGSGRQHRVWVTVPCTSDPKDKRRALACALSHFARRLWETFDERGEVVR